MKLNFLRRFLGNQKQSRTSGAIVSGIPGGVVWPERNYETFAKETYMKNVIAFACMDAIAKSTSSVPWKLLRKIDENQNEAVPDHPINAVLKRANPRESFTFLIYSIISYLCFTGNSFVEKVGPTTGPNQGGVKELYSLRPDRFKINTDKTGNISGYTYNVNGQSVEFPVDVVSGRCDIMHLKLFHPLDDFWGMAPIEPGAIDIDSHNNSAMWNKRLIENEARPGAVFIFETALNDAQFNRLQKQITEHREGPQYAGKSMIIEGGKDVKPFGFSPQEMDWIQSNKEIARHICNIWRVPPQIIGIPEANTYSNYQEARQAFWEETIIWYLQLLKDEFNYWLFPESYYSEDMFLTYILDDVPALAGKRDKMWERAEKADFVTINEKRKMVNMETVEAGDVILVPATMLPLGEEAPTAEDTAKAEEDEIQKLIASGMTREEAIAYMEMSI